MIIVVCTMILLLLLIIVVVVDGDSMIICVLVVIMLVVLVVVVIILSADVVAVVVDDEVCKSGEDDVCDNVGVAKLEVDVGFEDVELCDYHDGEVVCIVILILVQRFGDEINMELFPD